MSQTPSSLKPIARSRFNKMAMIERFEDLSELTTPHIEDIISESGSLWARTEPDKGGRVVDVMPLGSVDDSGLQIARVALGSININNNVRAKGRVSLAAMINPDTLTVDHLRRYAFDGSAVPIHQLSPPAVANTVKVLGRFADHFGVAI